ncbi:MAG: HvfB family MNIO-type RiPP peptide maturase [Gammaproteobacteria bacterium]
MNMTQQAVRGAGLGLRRQFLSEISHNPPAHIGFYEVAPENWITIGGKLGKQFRSMTERFDFVCHGLSLSIGSTDPLDEDFILAVKRFMAEHGIKLYSEHLSYCSNGGHLYDLMPMPFTEEAVKHTAARIRRVQDILEQKIAIENISYYAAPGREMDEIDFFNAVVAEADCQILIDINNIYVNSVNHGYSAEAFLRAIPADRIAYAHIAGHYVEAEDFLVDTHGAAVIDPVWKLLGKAYELYGVFPTLLERDFNIPSLAELLLEVKTIATIQQAWSKQHDRRYA